MSDQPIRIYSQIDRSQNWLDQFRGQKPLFTCVFGFTATGLIPGISAAGATPADRQYTAVADAEFLSQGIQPRPQYPLPPLTAGASPVLITRAIVTALDIPVYLLNAGLPVAASVPLIDLGGQPANCLSQAKAMDLAIVEQLWQQGLHWGEQLAAQVPQSYLLISECVVGGTTTALAVLTGLGWEANHKVNSSHPHCNHEQKWQVVQAGLTALAEQSSLQSVPNQSKCGVDAAWIDPLQLVAAVGDPMQVVVAGMAVAASRSVGVLLAGGTQMLAVYALAEAIANQKHLSWQPNQIVVGTTRWVADDRTGDTAGLAQQISAPLLATQLSFAGSHYAALRAYEQGYVKEGVGAGGCAIAATLYRNWNQEKLLEAIERLASELESAEARSY